MSNDNPTLFPLPESVKPELIVLPRKGAGYMSKRMGNIHTMWRMFGKRSDKMCKNCTHLIKWHKNKVFYKCDLTAMTSGASTDWRVGWAACGNYQEKPNG